MTHEFSQFLDELAARDGAYNGFNLFVSDLRTMWWHSNRAPGDVPHLVTPGIHGVSNAALDTPWPKVRTGVVAFAEVLTADDGRPGSPLGGYFEVLSSPTYGTRSSTVLRVRHDGSFDLAERSFGPEGAAAGERRINGVLNIQD